MRIVIPPDQHKRLFTRVTSGRVIVTRCSHHHIEHIAKHGTKRQRAKYRNAYVTICRSGVLLGIHYGFEVANPKGERRFQKAERRCGIPVPIFDASGGWLEPTWHGVKDRAGFFWNLWQFADDEPAAWTGRDDWYQRS